MKNVTPYRIGQCNKHNHNMIDMPCPWPNCENGVEGKTGVTYQWVNDAGKDVLKIHRFKWLGIGGEKHYEWILPDDKSPFVLVWSEVNKELRNIKSEENTMITYHFTDAHGLKEIIKNHCTASRNRKNLFF